jgi:hypothetical protein
MGCCPIAGVIWQHLHYLVGLQTLGHEVYYVEDSARYLYNPNNLETSEDYTYAVETLRSLSEAFDFRDRWAYCARFLDPPQSFGLSLLRLRELYTEADAVLNVCGAHELHEDLLRSDRLIYVESDPGFEQIRLDQDKDGDHLSRYQTLFTFGENIGTDLFPVPLHGLPWLPTRQPIVTDFWKTKAAPPKDAVFTTVSNWSTRGKRTLRGRAKPTFGASPRTSSDSSTLQKPPARPWKLPPTFTTYPPPTYFERRGGAWQVPVNFR